MDLSSRAIGEELKNGMERKKNRAIPSELSYGDAGSELFTKLCSDPDYYLSRAERRLLADNAEELNTILQQCDLIELGAGDCSKMIDLYSRNQPSRNQVKYFPNDINAWIVTKGALEFNARIAHSSVFPIVGDYYDAIEQLPKLRTDSNPQAVALLGSTFGNFLPKDRNKILKKLRSKLQYGDIFIVACDLFKPIRTISAAYNTTSKLLERMEFSSLFEINRLFKGNFDPNSFSHFCVFNHQSSYFESRLFSLLRQTIDIEDIDVHETLEVGESILMDRMWKPTLDQFRAVLDPKTWQVTRIFVDQDEQYSMMVGVAR
jgi:L-histidine Nalpha-methyltransferase